MADEPALPARIVLRPIANPLPLGVLGLALATTMYAALQLAWLDPEHGQVAAVAALFFTVPVQLIASVFGFLARDAVAGTGMALLAGTWATVAVITLTSPPGATNAGLGTVFVIAGVAMLVPAAPAWAGRAVPAAVLTTTAIRFAVTGGYELTGSGAWEAAAGVVGLALAALAVYAALALAFEDMKYRTVLPVGRRHAGAAAMSGSEHAQTETLTYEAGVRRQV
ncbi:GPR1/FUN34/YaaH family transporter [Phytoactinopolyspora halotolerans]|uniref:GPR1/FUN34/yaaH family protein n=1 Tax=Phytoactinopolyspora halotolerans TaxID=1981512 RepID=A0A6L9SAD6_9ACTN|nr:GPR1/FUN34/YaaH family transporter [Phytoactinopolyspora halotolerans]NEE01522.1 hypothetical protein [Phytoactinopolyspora halotolerans]